MRFVLLSLALLAFTSLPALAAEETRDVTKLERAYLGFALDQKSPHICAKIGPEALVTDRMQPAGRQVYYARTQCFMRLALLTQKPEYCTAVKRAADGLFAQGWYYTPENCKKLAGTGTPVEYTYAIDYFTVMKMLGYTEGEMKGRSWAKFYQDIRENQDKSLERRIRKMPDFSKTKIVPQ